MVPPYRFVDLKWRMLFNNIRAILLKSNCDHLCASVQICYLRWWTLFNNIHVILLKSILNDTNVYAVTYILLKSIRHFGTLARWFLIISCRRADWRCFLIIYTCILLKR